MKFTATSIPDVILVEPQVLGDQRGFFIETYQANKYAQAGITAEFVQDNHSGSRQGVLRGLHYQIRYPQGKLLRVISGKIFDVAVDLRRYSPTFGQWVGTILSAQNHLQMWVPPGFAHGFYVISEWAELIYKVTDRYAPQWERTLRWNDPQVNIEWPLVGNAAPLLSEKDEQGKYLTEAEYYQ